MKQPASFRLPLACATVISGSSVSSSEYTRDSAASGSQSTLSGTSMGETTGELDSPHDEAAVARRDGAGVGYDDEETGATVVADDGESVGISVPT